MVIGESRTFSGGVAWLAEYGVETIDLDSDECASLMTAFIEAEPEIWLEDIGE